MARRWFASTIEGWATQEGTKRLISRGHTAAKGHFRGTGEGAPFISSIGIGTYIGPPDDETDLAVQKAVVRAVQSNCVNHIDTAINYRYQKAERSVGKAISALLNLGYSRDELVLSSKIGYVTEDADKGIPGSAVVGRLIEEGKMEKEDVVAGVHCMHPAFLADQLERSLSNLGVSTLDVLYLHNCVEGQLPVVGKEVFLTRLSKAIEFCQSAVLSNKAKSYGLATWLCFRSPPDESHLHLSLEELMSLTLRVAGPAHHLQFIQLPINIMMPEAFVMPWQASKSGKDMFVNVASDHNLNVIVSSPLFQGKLASVPLPTPLTPPITDLGAMHLQLIRSLPAKCVKSVLVGMKKEDNLRENLKVGGVEPLKTEEFWDALKPEGQKQAKIGIKLR